jgi:hypothetical protein
LNGVRDQLRRLAAQPNKEHMMNAKKVLLLVVLADFLAVTAWGVAKVGYVELFSSLLALPAGIVVGADLLISLGLVAVWMFRDARARGVSAVPYLVLTLLLGSVGPLVYLLRRPEPDQADAHVRLATQPG